VFRARAARRHHAHLRDAAWFRKTMADIDAKVDRGLTDQERAEIAAALAAPSAPIRQGRLL